MRVTSIIFSMVPGFRVALYELSQHPEIWIGDFEDLPTMITALHAIGIVSDEERAELSRHDFTHNFTTTQAEIDMVDAITSGFLPYMKEPAR